MKTSTDPVATFECEIDLKRCLLRWEDDGGAVAPTTVAKAVEENFKRHHANRDRTRLGLRRRLSRGPNGSLRRVRSSAGSPRRPHQPRRRRRSSGKARAKRLRLVERAGNATGCGLNGGAWLTMGNVDKRLLRPTAKPIPSIRARRTHAVSEIRMEG